MKFSINNIINKKKFKFQNNIFLYILKIIIAVIMIFFTIYIAHLLSNIIKKIKFNEYNEKKKDINQNKNHMSVILSIFVKYTIYFLGIYLVFLFLGFNTSLILAAFGTCGIAVALGLQDSLSNLVAGILLTFTNKIKINNLIETNVDKGQGMNESLVGIVIGFDLLTVQIKDVHTGLKYTITNSKIWNSVTSNYNYFDNKIYITVKIKISEDNDLKKALKIAKEVCLNEKQIIKEDTWPSPFINIYNSENLCGLTMMVKFLTDTKYYPNIKDTIQNNIIIKFKENNIKLINCSNLLSNNGK